MIPIVTSMKTVAILLLFVVLAVYARPQQTETQNEEDSFIPYDFQYKVDNSPTNTYFGQSENNQQGNGGVVGKYYVALADGRLMTVEYLVDGESGFIPRISYQNNSNFTNNS